MAVAVGFPLVRNLDDSAQRLRGMLAVSLVLHGILFLVIGGLRWAPKIERPLSTYQVSLVSLPTTGRSTPTVKPIPVPPQPAPLPTRKVERLETPKEPVAPRPSPRPEPVSPAKEAAVAPPPPPLPRAVVDPVKVFQPPKATTPKQQGATGVFQRATAPRVAPSTAAPKEAVISKSELDPLVQDVLKGIELPPDVPKLGEVTPTLSPVPGKRAEVERQDQAAQKLSNRIRELRVPEVAVPSLQTKSSVKPTNGERAKPIVSSDLLDKLQQPLEPIQQLPEPDQMDPKEFRLPAAKVPPPVSVSSARTQQSDAGPVTSIQPMGNGNNSYWALVQQKINRQWVAPPVDLTRRYFQVAIRFVMDRSGRVSGVSVERSSGNDYYDNAGRRAVLAADPLPPFPSEIKEQQLSPIIIFTVGEAAG